MIKKLGVMVDSKLDYFPSGKENKKLEKRFGIPLDYQGH